MSMLLIDRLEEELRQLDERSLRRRRRIVSSACGPHVDMDGRPMLAFASNDYLGLAAHPRIAEALRAGVSRYGAGSGASHLISGHSQAHAQLEEKLADLLSPHLPDARALYFCTGYMANIGVLAALGQRDTDLFSETLNHASLIDGARLSRANVRVYPHADTATLARMLEASEASSKIVVTDSVFSMDGNIAPLAELLALCERHGAWLMVDDAHGFGVLGEQGRGVLEHAALRSSNLIYIGTLGKAAGVGGAFVAAHATVIEWLVQRARAYIYTTAAPPALAHALLTAVDLIAGEEGRERRMHLQALTTQLRAELTLRHWKLLPSPTPIQPVVIGANDATLAAAAALDRQGLWVPAIRPPTVPPDSARLRITLSAAHTARDITQLATALNTVERSQT
jgi:8-amino-7-oxononanoate synthase